MCQKFPSSFTFPKTVVFADPRAAHDNLPTRPLYFTDHDATFAVSQSIKARMVARVRSLSKAFPIRAPLPIESRLVWSARPPPRRAARACVRVRNARSGRPTGGTARRRPARADRFFAESGDIAHRPSVRPPACPPAGRLYRRRDARA